MEFSETVYFHISYISNELVLGERDVKFDARLTKDIQWECADLIEELEVERSGDLTIYFGLWSGHCGMRLSWGLGHGWWCQD